LRQCRDLRDDVGMHRCLLSLEASKTVNHDSTEHAVAQHLKAIAERFRQVFSLAENRANSVENCLDVGRTSRLTGPPEGFALVAANLNMLAFFQEVTHEPCTT